MRNGEEKTTAIRRQDKMDSKLKKDESKLMKIRKQAEDETKR
jgi:hypothetical protein